MLQARKNVLPRTQATAEPWAYLDENEDERTYIPAKKLTTYLTNICLDEMNPDWDIEPRGRYNAHTIAQIPNMETAGRMVILHNPKGQLIGVLKWARFTDLHRRYFHKNPEDTTQNFLRETHLLLTRYSADIKNHWATPTELMSLIQRALNIQIEMFASPLNVHHNTTMYYSAHKEDENFGAIWNGYSHQTNKPAQGNPEYTPEQLYKALHHAVQATYRTLPRDSTMLAEDKDKEAPVLQLLVYPNWKEEPYKKWLKHPRVHVLAEIPEGECAFIPPDYFKGTTLQKEENTANWGVYLILVANSEGIKQWYNHDTLQTLWKEYFTGRTEPELHKPTKLELTDHEAAVRGLAKSCRIYKRTQAFAELPLAPEPPTIPQPPEPDVPEWTTEHLRWPQKAYIYTDGSKVDKRDTDGTGSIPKIGAAYYDDTIPEEEPTEDVTYIEPTARGMNNTVTRAELVAIYTALNNLQERRELKILTDSATSLQLIQKTIKQPMEVRDHLHKAVLFTTADLIKQRDTEGKTTFLGKVRAHIGVRGNEKADEAAKYMAKTWAPSRPHITVDLGAEPHTPQFWPAADPEIHPNMNPSPGNTEPVRLRDCTKQVRKLCRNKLCTYGSNTQAIHFLELQKLLNSDWMQKLSTKTYTSRNTPYKMKRALHKLMMGVFPSQRLMFLYNPQLYQTPRCVLCGNRPHNSRHTQQEWNKTDGCGHIMGGCSHPILKAIYIKRHNKGVMICARAIAKGKTGRWILVADLNEECRTELSEQGNKVPGRIQAYLLPNTPAHIRDRLRPDILFQRSVDEVGSKAHAIQNKEKYPITIIELGYCRDSKFDEKRKEKREQHKELTRLLTEEGWDS